MMRQITRDTPINSARSAPRAEGAALAKTHHDAAIDRMQVPLSLFRCLTEDGQPTVHHTPSDCASRTHQQNPPVDRAKMDGLGVTIYLYSTIGGGHADAPESERADSDTAVSGF